MSDAPAELVAEVELATASATTLLRAKDSLTHQVHDAAAEARILKGIGRSGRALDQRAASLRAQRDLIDNELLRRLGEQP